MDCPQVYPMAQRRRVSSVKPRALNQARARSPREVHSCCSQSKAAREAEDCTGDTTIFRGRAGLENGPCLHRRGTDHTIPPRGWRRFCGGGYLLRSDPTDPLDTLHGGMRIYDPSRTLRTLRTIQRFGVVMPFSLKAHNYPSVSAHCAQLVLPHHDGLRTLRTLRKTQRPPSCVSYWSEATSGSQTDHELPPYGNRTLAHITQNRLSPP